MTDKLLPCPFCGSEAEVVYAWYPDEVTHIACKQCGAAVETEKEWNSRTGVYCSQCKHFHSKGDYSSNGDVYECDWCDMVSDVAYQDGFCAWGERMNDD